MTCFRGEHFQRSVHQLESISYSIILKKNYAIKQAIRLAFISIIKETIRRFKSIRTCNAIFENQISSSVVWYFVLNHNLLHTNWQHIWWRVRYEFQLNGQMPEFWYCISIRVTSILHAKSWMKNGSDFFHLTWFSVRKKCLARERRISFVARIK